MGTVYCGPCADEIGYHDHEGYAARILPDGTEIGSWTYATREFYGYRAGCACGWTGTAIHPPTVAGEDAALDDWDDDHLRPLIQAGAQRHVVSARDLLTLVQNLRSTVTFATNEHGEEVLHERSRGVLDAVKQIEQLLDELAQHSQTT